MARLYADEDFDYPIVKELRRLGHDVLTVQEAGQGNQATSDDAVLSFAIADGRAVVTLNRRHFLRLHRRTPAPPGIIICTWDADSVALAARIHEALSARSSFDNQLVRVRRPQRPR